jgi:hypothetical protein
MKQIITLLLILFSINSACQINENKARLEVLDSGKTDSLFVFGKWSSDGQTQSELKYLGQIVTDSGQVYKILNSSFIWGLSRRATNRILIYTINNEYVGNYYLHTVSDLPEKIENGQLVFTNKGKEDCDKSIITTIDFRTGYPKEILIKCTETDVEIFTFSSDL